MIKLTQVITTTVGVTRNDQDGPVVEKKHSFRDVWVNPRYVIKVEDDPVLNGDNERSPLVEGLDKRVGFSRIHISSNNYATHFSAVGHPNMVVSKINSKD